MSLVFPLSGDQWALKYMLGVSTAPDVVLHLYTNNYTPSTSTALGNLTECSLTGYTTKTLSADNWVFSPTNTATYPEQRFNLVEGSADIYGYYITTDGNLFWAERLPIPVNIPLSGAAVLITPTITAN